MGKRSYGHVCALAQALDIVGERWTLMIVRELLFGGRRYTDLQRGLPGLGSNLLAQRLRDLERAGVIQQRRLPPPAGSSVYELTAAGRVALTPVIRALTNFGLPYLQFPPDGADFVPASSTMGAIAKFFRPERARGVSLGVAFDTGEDLFSCEIQDGEMVALGFGGLPTAVLRLRGSTDSFMGLVVGYLTAAEQLKTGAVQLERGTAVLATTFFDLFAAPEP